MKVKCVRLFASDGTEVEKSPWMRIGRIYDVLSVSIFEGRASLRIIGEESQTPALFAANGLEIVDRSLPRNWVIDVDEHGVRLGPTAWMAPDFWSRYFDQEDEALRTFEEVRFETKIGSDGSAVPADTAFEALRGACWNLSALLQSDDLSTLFADMSAIDGKFPDPAIPGEWESSWGALRALPLRAAFSATVRFLILERGWTDESALLDLLEEARAVEKEPRGRLWEAWFSALKLGGTAQN